MDYQEKIRRHAYKIIKKYNRNPNKKTINDFVNENLSFQKEPSEFVLGYIIEVFEAIDKGISIYYKAKSQSNF